MTIVTVLKTKALKESKEFLQKTLKLLYFKLNSKVLHIELPFFFLPLFLITSTFA